MKSLAILTILSLVLSITGVLALESFKQSAQIRIDNVVSNTASEKLWFVYGTQQTDKTYFTKSKGIINLVQKDGKNSTRGFLYLYDGSRLVMTFQFLGPASSLYIISEESLVMSKVETLVVDYKTGETFITNTGIFADDDVFSLQFGHKDKAFILFQSAEVIVK